MAGPADLYDLCADYLSACAAAVEGTPGGAIVRAFVSPGPPAFDCAPQLTVHAGGPVIGDTVPMTPPLQPGFRVDDTGTVNLVTMTATVLRCSPVPGKSGHPPSAVQLDASAQETTADVWAIWQWLKARKKDRTLWPDRDLYLDPAVVLQPQGGVAGWQLQIRVRLDGYDA